jgi:hypothetical protein
MPQVPPGRIFRDPTSIVDGGKYTLGWKTTKNDGNCFILIRRNVMAIRVLEQFPMTQEGWAKAWAALVKLDTDAAQAVAKQIQAWSEENAARAARMERWTQMYEAFDGREPTLFRLLGVQVLADQVYTIGDHFTTTRTNTSALLGPLAGAQAMVTDGSQAWSPGRAMFLPVGLTGLATKTKADAAVVFPDGTAHTSPLDGNYAVREAQKQVVQFNALAGAVAPAPADTADSDPATRLRKLQELLDAGLLRQEEYETKRAEIISQL